MVFCAMFRGIYQQEVPPLDRCDGLLVLMLKAIPYMYSVVLGSKRFPPVHQQNAAELWGNSARDLDKGRNMNAKCRISSLFLQVRHLYLRELVDILVSCIGPIIA